MPQQQRSAKGNPAARRMSNPTLKANRQRSWRRGEERHTARDNVQYAAHKANEALRKAGLPTPWERACKARAERRAADPEVQRRRAQVFTGGGRS